jgi:hypothetical protein
VGAIMVAQAGSARWVGAMLWLIPSSLRTSLDAWSRELAQKKAAQRKARVARKQRQRQQVTAHV